MHSGNISEELTDACQRGEQVDNPEVEVAAC